MGEGLCRDTDEIKEKGMIDRKEEALKLYFTEKHAEGMSTVYTPRSVRERMTIHAREDDRVLVLFNLEFVVDLRGRVRELWFASDDPKRLKIAEEMGVRTELIDPRSITKSEISKMKFDLIISNPPYTDKIDLRILKEIEKISERICFVHPMTWLLDAKSNKSYSRLKETLKNRYVSAERIDAFQAFGVSMVVPCAITYFDEKGGGDIYGEDLHGNSEIYKSIKRKILHYCENDNLLNHLDKDIHYRWKVGFNGLRGHGNYDMWTTIQGTDREKHIGEDPRYSMKFGFETEEKARNFLGYLQLKFTRFCLSILKINRHVDRGEIASVPWFDFTQKWSDEKCAREAGITSEELFWMTEWIEDYDGYGWVEKATTYLFREHVMKGLLRGVSPLPDSEDNSEIALQTSDGEIQLRVLRKMKDDVGSTHFQIHVNGEILPKTFHTRDAAEAMKSECEKANLKLPDVPETDRVPLP